VKALVLALFLLIALGQLALFFFLFLRFRQVKLAFGRRSSLRPLLILVGGIFFLVGCGFGLYSAYLVATGIRTQGEVIDYEERHSKNGFAYAPIFVFTNQAGGRIQVTSSMASSPRSFHVGAAIPVIYRASNAYSARPDTFSDNWTVPVVFGGGGAILLVVGVTLPIWRTLFRI
jgi:hypothetical protein